ncbi:aquaporin [Nocardia sp. NPDC058058]|uniref:aquaporin n=1 Tax=Nocardia sp. NPDC058058 TaxID=3346317 RepID=UPI0036D842B7
MSWQPTRSGVERRVEPAGAQEFSDTHRSGRRSPYGPGRRFAAEYLGTALLVAVVIGSGISAQRWSPSDLGLQVLESSIAIMLGLWVLILVFGPISGAHFNPVVSVVDWVLGRRIGRGLPGSEVFAYAIAQTLGAVSGAILANIMFDLAPLQISTNHRVTTGHLVGELVATAGLLSVILALARSARPALSAAAVSAYIGAACWFTSSTAFANPAITLGRTLSDTLAGIAPASAPAYIAAQIVGAAIGLAIISWFYPDAPAAADNVTVLHRVPGSRR